MFNTILVPVDVTVEVDTAKLLARARKLKEAWGSEIHVTSVVPDAGFPIVSQQLPKGIEHQISAGAKGTLGAALEAAGLEAEVHITTGKSIYDRVLAVANQVGADLIMVGAHHPELKDYLLGTNAARLVRHSKTSVLVIRD